MGLSVEHSTFDVGLPSLTIGLPRCVPGSIEPTTDSYGTLGGMCRVVVCRKCGRPGWAGCGQHVEQVLGDVPGSERCQCEADKPARWLKSWFGR